jgi:hypothetical protein
MEGELSSETSRSVVVHFMLDKRKPLGVLSFVKGSAIKKAVGKRKGEWGREKPLVKRGF